MILEFICNIFFALARFVLSLIPSFPNVDFVNIDFSPLYYILGFIDNFVSIRLIATCCITILVIYNIRFAWKIISWFVSKIPGIN